MNAFNPFRQTLPTTAPRSAGLGPVSLRSRYRDAAMSWIALGALLAAWHVEARLDSADTDSLDPRLAKEKRVLPGSEMPIRIVRADARSWIEGTPRGLRTR
jgi:hypothetical protein